ncbi:MAG: hypothetical protein V4864_23825 [Pseudomonadota bacterium]
MADSAGFAAFIASKKDAKAKSADDKKGAIKAAAKRKAAKK